MCWDRRRSCVMYDNNIIIIMFFELILCKRRDREKYPLYDNIIRRVDWPNNNQIQLIVIIAQFEFSIFPFGNYSARIRMTI